MTAGLVLLVVGFFGIKSFTTYQKQHSSNQLSQQFGAASGIDDIAASQNSIPLTPTGAATDDSGGLSVSSSNASSSLAQLDGSSRTQAGTAAGTSSSSNNTFDTSTFAQYEKYKDSQGALFGDAQVGNGAELTAGHKAAVYYKGWLTNGQLFDQSKPGSDGKLQAFVFTLGDHKVIPGLEQGLAGMKVGGVRLLIVPPAVGYGATGQGSIPPNATLIFQVQLAAVE